MKILAIDPSDDKHAFVVWDTETNNFVDSYTVDVDDIKVPFEAKGYFKKVYELGQLHISSVQLVAIEMIQSYGMGVGRTTFETCLNVGRLIEQFQGEGKNNIKLYGRPAIKGQIGGRNDTEIRRALRIRHGEAKKGHKLEGVKKDLWAALALAVALTENPNLKEW